MVCGGVTIREGIQLLLTKRIQGHGADACSLQWKYQVVNWLIGYGVDVNIRENKGWAALSLAKL